MDGGDGDVWKISRMLDRWGRKIMPPAHPSLYTAIGELTAEVRALRRESAASARAADAERLQVREKLDTVDQRSSRLEVELNSMSKKLRTDVYPVIDKVGRWEQRMAGALALAIMLSSVATMVLFQYGPTIMTWIRG